jgi:hypothetical protein
MNMKKILQACVDDADIIELMRILLDKDSEGAYIFLQTHFKGKARELFEGG